MWFDSNNLRGNHKLIDEIAARLERAAMFVAILSPGYIASQWCQDEAHMFARGCGGGPGRRLFVIEKAPLDNEPGPPAFTGRRAYRFWYSDRAEQPRTLRSRSRVPTRSIISDRSRMSPATCETCAVRCDATKRARR